MQVTVFFSAVAEYSDALKESIRRQTEYLAQASPTMSNVRTDHIFTNILMQHGRKPVEDLKREFFWRPREIKKMWHMPRKSPTFILRSKIP